MSSRPARDEKEAKRARLQIALLTALGVVIALTAEWPLAAGTDFKYQATQALKWAAVYACHHFSLRAAWRGGLARGAKSS